MSGTKVLVDGKLKHVGYDADVSVFSYQAVKNLPTADSGMVCFKNDDYDILARKLSWLGIDKDTYQRTNDKGSYKWEYELVDVGYKYHGNSIMASMAIVGLKYLEQDNQRRREICELYDKYFSGTLIKKVIMSPETTVSSRHLYQIVVPERNKIMEYLTQLDKLQITLDIIYKLRNFEAPDGKIDLFDEKYSFVPKLKKIFNDYIHSEKQFKGSLAFEEIGKQIDYRLPNMNNKQPLFVIRMK
jgi:dTDP-4-amino-4,6-dideoxygalactose transaminase